MKFQELTTEDEWRAAFPVMHELRHMLLEKEFLQLREILVGEGYRLFAARDQNVIVALAGIAILTNLFYGRHVWVYDLVTADAARSQGYGQGLLNFVEEFARRENCRCIALSSGLQRTNAHRFYEQHMEYNIWNTTKRVMCFKNRYVKSAVRPRMNRLALAFPSFGAHRKTAITRARN